MPATETSRSNAIRLDNQREAWKLRVEGYSQQEIADKLGVSQRTISNWLRAAYPEYMKEHHELAADFTKWHLARCEAWLTSLKDGLSVGDPKAVNAAVRVLQHEAKIVGIEQAPQGQKIEVNLGEDQIKEELRKRGLIVE